MSRLEGRIGDRKQFEGRFSILVKLGASLRRPRDGEQGAKLLVLAVSPEKFPFGHSPQCLQQIKPRHYKLKQCLYCPFELSVLFAKENNAGVKLCEVASLVAILRDCLHETRR
jgi:hypothetical protein